MTNEEIKKALECCIKPTSDCDNCSYYGYDDDLQCFDISKRDALDLINRQQAQLEYLQGEREVLLEDIKASSNQVIEQQTEIEKLNVELVGMRGACNSYKMHYDNAKAEIERLERHTEMYHELRADAIKEVEAKIHEKLHEAEMYGNFEPVVTREMFDSVVKEMGVRVSDNTDK
jgi:chromosome segregation ATPase